MRDESNKSVSQTIRYAIDSTERQSGFFRHVSPMLSRQKLILSVSKLQELLTLQVCQGLKFFDNPNLATEVKHACADCAAVDVATDNAKHMSKLQIAQKLIIAAAMIELNKSFFDFARTLMPGTLQTMIVGLHGRNKFEATLSEDPKAVQKWNHQLKTWCDVVEEPMHRVADHEVLIEQLPKAASTEFAACDCFDNDCFQLHRIWPAFLASKHAPHTQLTRVNGAHPYYGFVDGVTTSNLSAILLPTLEHSCFGLKSLGEYDGVERTGGIVFSPITKAPHLLQDAVAHMVAVHQTRPWLTPLRVYRWSRRSQTSSQSRTCPKRSTPMRNWIAPSTVMASGGQHAAPGLLDMCSSPQLHSTYIRYHNWRAQKAADTLVSNAARPHYSAVQCYMATLVPGPRCCLATLMSILQNSDACPILWLVCTQISLSYMQLSSCVMNISCSKLGFICFIRIWRS